MSSIIKSFGGVPTPSFLIINDVNFQALPASQLKSTDIPLRSGSVFINKKYGARTWSVDFTIKANTPQEVMYRADDLAAWLDYSEPQELIFRDKPNIAYMAMVDGAVEVDKFGRTGKGSITFISFDPHGYGAERSYNLTSINGEPVLVVNGGNTMTAPVISMQFTQNVTDFAIASNDDMLYFGSPFDVTTQTPKNLSPYVLQDAMETTNGWTSGLSVDSGVVAGTIGVNSTYLSQSDKNYGSQTSGWHGGSLIKSLGKEIQDFTVTASFGFKASNINQIGRVEVYFLDINGNKIGKMAMVDPHSNGDYPKFQARAGAESGGHYIVNAYGTNKDTFRQFEGVFQVTRKGNRWETYVAKVGTNGVHHTRMNNTWTDSSNRFKSKIAAVQIHFGQYQQTPVVNSMYISDLKVQEYITPLVNEVGFVFNAGDNLIIDNASGEILKNGAPFFSDLYPSSSFIKLDKGVNGISISSPVITNGKIIFKERWL